MLNKFGTLLIVTLVVNIFMVPVTIYNEESFIGFLITLSFTAFIFYLCYITGLKQDKKFMLLLLVYSVVNPILQFGSEVLMYRIFLDSQLVLLLRGWYNFPLNGIGFVIDYSGQTNVMVVAFIPFVLSIIGYYVGMKKTLNKNI